MVKKAPDRSSASVKDQGAGKNQLQEPKYPYRAHALHQLPKEHPGRDPGVPVYTATTACERGRDGSAHLWPSLTAQD